MKNKLWLIPIVIIIIVGFYFYVNYLPHDNQANQARKSSQTEGQSNNTDISSAENNGSVAPCSYIFKTRSDYSGLLTVLYDTVTRNVTAFPVVLIKQLPRNYSYGVYGCGINFAGYTAVTNFTFDGVNFPSGALKELIIDYDPFIEMYECRNNETAVYGYLYSEAELQNIIVNDQLNSKCKKIK